MIEYQDLHWPSINFLKNHLYRRIASPLNSALGRLAIAQHINDPAAAKEQFQRIEMSLEIALNLIKAWAALIHVQAGGVIRDFQRRQITPAAWPSWLVNYLSSQTTCRFDHSETIFVHPETFYESLILLSQIGGAVGNLKHLSTANATGKYKGVWVRAVFEPPQSGPYASLNKLVESLDLDNSADRDIAIQMQVLGGLMKINQMRFTLQNNTQSNEQALSALLPPAPPARDLPLQAVTEKIAASESRDPALDHEPSTAQPVIAEVSTEPADDKPHLTGPVIAPTPHDLDTPDALPDTKPNSMEHTISGPVIAPTPRRLPKSEQPAENNHNVRLIPPTDFRQRISGLKPVLPPDNIASPPPNGTTGTRE